MIKVEVIEQFTLKDYEKIKDSIKRKSIDIKGTLFVGDTFECDEEMCAYLMGKNELGKTVVKVIEVEPKIDKTKVKQLKEAPKEDELTKEQVKYYTSKNKKTSKKDK